MATMAVRVRTAPPLAGTERRPSAAVRPLAFLSFAVASTGARGRVGRGLSATTVGSGSAARARAVPRGIVASSEVEQSYVMIKPDGVQRGLEHYKDLKDKPFFPTLIDYITSGPVVCMAWEGDGVVASARKLIGSNNPLQAEPGTIRGDLAVQTGRNVVHGSDSPDNGKREIALWFEEGELCQWESVQTPWLVE
ncbi:nucleoside diphosphate kinase 2, chloroplastic-like isoform X1 [Panicum hallii]|uniref:nucleoside diphosphate kinase 2, chloroplastic-like isoform X1 n=1 Tax=Panicum hallii TaxID=206008 RepID=UPI000DF4D9AA|nr:nucleoside diphosphate kinase 2, chloroplastic-like isoform X1 [Panicum hallii]